MVVIYSNQKAGNSVLRECGVDEGELGKISQFEIMVWLTADLTPEMVTPRSVEPQALQCLQRLGVLSVIIHIGMLVD